MATLQLSGTRIEELAAKAVEREALGGFNIAAARLTLTEMLNAVGRTTEFSTYTRHDISHIDALLAAADWIIPDITHDALTVADALVITLSIYCHDLGMLVTRQEFDRREESLFPAFKQEVLTDTSQRGTALKERLAAIPAEDGEHFLYEEFVRRNHAERVELWIRGQNSRHLGAADEAASLVQEVLAPLQTIIRDDVATVSRSHHEDDLDDFSKYKVNRAYGQDRLDMANVQYAALVLRTVDLIHITRDRTPSVQYRLSTPVDPLGQVEWKKQQAVRAVRPADTAPGDTADTIEVHARFTSPDGYFALMEYLDYAEKQLELSRRWAGQATDQFSRAAVYVFPWREVDRQHIETEGFEPRHLYFTFDQEKVLELLTGHTLYNDASVALREIAQNSIDAVRLAAAVGVSKPTPTTEDVLVSFESADRRLRVTDHGVGMTRDTIEAHFLKVGSSSYQTREFKEKHPDFYAISRFGIGVLSAFMVADEVRVATKHFSETNGHEVLLRSVHGSYLVRDLPAGDEAALRIGTSGTEVELKLREDFKLNQKLRELLEQWIVLPGHSIRLMVDGQDLGLLGFDTVESAIRSVLETVFTGDESGERRWDVYSYTDAQRGISIAAGRVWNKEYREWELIRWASDASADEDPSDRTSPVQLAARAAGICLQGVKVSNGVPGFRGRGPLILMDVSGPHAPSTNVARTQIESGPGHDDVVLAVYRALAMSIESQLPQLSSRISPRFALYEMSHLYLQATTRNLQERTSEISKPSLLAQEFSKHRLHPVELNGSLTPMSADELKESGFLTLVGPAAEDAARFLEWAPRDIGLIPLLQSGGLLDDVLQDAPLLADTRSLFSYDELLWQRFELVSFSALQDATGILLKLSEGGGRWESDRRLRRAANTKMRDLHRFLPEYFRMTMSGRTEHNEFARPDVESLRSFDGYTAISISGRRLHLSDSPAALAFFDILPRMDEKTGEALDEMASLLLLCDLMAGPRWVLQGDRGVRTLLDEWIGRSDHANWPSIQYLQDVGASLNRSCLWQASNAWQRRRQGMQ